MKKSIVFDNEQGRIIKEELVSVKYSGKFNKEVKFEKVVYKARRNDGKKGDFTTLKEAKKFVTGATIE